MSDIQDAPMPADAQSFTVTIGRAFVAELRQRTNPDDRRWANSKARRALYRGAFRSAVNKTAEFFLDDDEPSPWKGEDLAPGLKMGNPFVHRLITGYRHNTIVVTDDAITVESGHAGGMIRWVELTFWGVDEFAYLFADNKSQSLALPVDQVPAEVAGRLLDSAGRIRPPGVHDNHE